MNLSLMLFIIGIICMIGSIVNNEDNCNNNIEIKYVPRDVYDEIIKNKVINFDEN